MSKYIIRDKNKSRLLVNWFQVYMDVGWSWNNRNRAWNDRVDKFNLEEGRDYNSDLRIIKGHSSPIHCAHVSLPRFMDIMEQISYAKPEMVNKALVIINEINDYCVSQNIQESSWADQYVKVTGKIRARIKRFDKKIEKRLCLKSDPDLARKVTSKMFEVNVPEINEEGLKDSSVQTDKQSERQLQGPAGKCLETLFDFKKSEVTTPKQEDVTPVKETSKTQNDITFFKEIFNKMIKVLIIPEIDKRIEQVIDQRLEQKMKIAKQQMQEKMQNAIKSIDI